MLAALMTPRTRYTSPGSPLTSASSPSRRPESSCARRASIPCSETGRSKIRSETSYSRAILLSSPEAASARSSSSSQSPLPSGESPAASLSISLINLRRSKILPSPDSRSPTPVAPLSLSSHLLISWGLRGGIRRSMLSRWRSRALPDHGVKGIGEHAARASVETAYVLEVARFSQVAFDQPHVAPVVQSLPDGDGLGREAAVGEGDDERRPDLQDAANLPQDLHGLRQVVNGDADTRPVELPIFKGQARVTVEVLNHVGVEPRVLTQLHLVHAQAHHAPVLDFRRQVRGPTAHQVEHRSSWWEELPVELRDGGYGPPVYVGDEAGRPVELLVRRFVHAPHRPIR